MSAERLTLERMRADIAAMVHEDPSAIGDEDNLMDLGLDSMRAMNLVVRWRDAMGVPLEFTDLAEHVTLAGWWAVVRGRQEGS
ncbi:phosphopantetheine-binding protein [Pendulispora albinea]|uniref:Phosphopantetheine-binding protein n=1 Tax=Pendulispora albinea TaxID=2741071 RepID=A0ABZ2LNX4_9BACT